MSSLMLVEKDFRSSNCNSHLFEQVATIINSINKNYMYLEAIKLALLMFPLTKTYMSYRCDKILIAYFTV